MKTKENNPGNRKQNAKNALLKISTVIISFVLISITVKAQDYWEKYLAINSTRIATMSESYNTEMNKDENVSLFDIEALTYFIEPAMEETLELETWMTDRFFINAYSYILEVEVENKLELEEWMVNETFFTIPFTVEVEEELKLENWMMNEKIWR